MDSTGTPSTPSEKTPIERVAILFAGGPAPAANAVISTAAASFLKQGIKVIGILNGYSNLVEYSAHRSMEAGKDYIFLDEQRLRRTRNSRGIMIGTARTNPGKEIRSPKDLEDEAKRAPLATVHAALSSLGVDALVSIGGDDTLKTANKFKLVQKYLPPGSKHIAVVHVPKTIDNDYKGIDFTFGYFTAVETLAGEIRNLLADAESTQSYFLAETMGRSAGWLAYGAAIAGEASLVLSVEDIKEKYLEQKPVEDQKTGETKVRDVMKIDTVVDHIVKAMLAREKDGKNFGVIVLAEGLAEYMPEKYLEGIDRDEHGHISIGDVHLGRTFARLVAEHYKKKSEGKRERKVNGVQLGYEARCALPHAFDVMLGSQLGVGAYRALCEKNRDGVMVSVVGQLSLHYVPFEKLIDPETLVTVVRYIKVNSDFHRLARFLETEVGE